jgi:hypothetical protein
VGLTSVVKVIESPYAEGFSVDVTFIVAGVGFEYTVCVIDGLMLVAKLASPL